MLSAPNQASVETCDQDLSSLLQEQPRKTFQSSERGRGAGRSRDRGE